MRSATISYTSPIQALGVQVCLFPLEAVPSPLCLITARTSANAGVIPSPTHQPSSCVTDTDTPSCSRKPSTVSLCPHTLRPWPLSHAVSSDRQARGYNLKRPQQHTNQPDRQWQRHTTARNTVPGAAEIESQTRRDTMTTRTESLNPGSV